MKFKKYSVICQTVALSAVVLTLGACSGTSESGAPIMVETPTVDYVESLDVNSASHNDSFLNTLAMNYRSYAIYNARTSGYSEMGEVFAQKAVAAFSGETPFPETLDNWPIEDENISFELHTASNDLLEQLKNDASYEYPKLAAEAQAKYDCWLSSTASGQTDTASECKIRFEKAINALKNDGMIAGCSDPITGEKSVECETQTVAKVTKTEKQYYPQAPSARAAGVANRSREGIVIVNNVNVPANLINPVPVQSVRSAQPIVFNQHIYGGERGVKVCENGQCDDNTLGNQFVTRDEFINMMMAMRRELQSINSRLDAIDKKVDDKAVLKVQQIPLEPKQHVMEEIFEIRFDFNKAEIKPEYADVIRKLATTCQSNKNIKVSVVGHTDTMGASGYNYALGGARAESVQKMLIKYGIPASQIVTVSAGEKDNKVSTGDGVANPDNRRVRVIKEVHYTDPSTVSMD